jgi:hypothetical protein
VRNCWWSRDFCDDLDDLRLVDDAVARRQLVCRLDDLLVHTEDGDGVHGPDDHSVAGGELDRLLALDDGAVGGGRQHGVGVPGLAVPEVEPHLDAAEEGATHVRVLVNNNVQASIIGWSSDQTIASVWTIKLKSSVNCLIRYHDVWVIGEEPVAEPRDGAEGEAEGQADGQELHALRLHHLHDDAERRHEDGHGEGQAYAAQELDAVRRRDELQRGEHDERERRHVQQQEVGDGPDPGLPGRVHEVEDDVGRLDAAAEGVDGEQRPGVGLHQRVEDPQHRAEECHNVRHRAEPARRLLAVHLQERRAAPTEKNIQSTVSYRLHEQVNSETIEDGLDERSKNSYTGARNTRKDTMFPAERKNRGHDLSVIQFSINIFHT